MGRPCRDARLRHAGPCRRPGHRQPLTAVKPLLTATSIYAMFNGRLRICTFRRLGCLYGGAASIGDCKPPSRLGGLSGVGYAMSLGRIGLLGINTEILWYYWDCK
ncbi:hypothetical protein HBI56_024300 [Parastagonospora nodorum]|nr:hypothetical protein HBH53_085500 [Parastagonospora nodorum]KAH3976077.1 hypothetical protein HBH51_079870 [Parastagonospora nodorum]KAH3985048.1 hypothetical protein HBH52_056610 [Parastagonospora nodorum]KAH4006318.1 hypothetical protein HBI10_029000 [Parastagonospora nodorum]KAH4023251.1 hypothetical protein HBI13_096610 [Parastagonospora nodorum]